MRHFLLSLLLATACSPSSINQRHAARVALANPAEDVRSLAAAGLDVIAVNGDEADVVASDGDDLRALRALGLTMLRDEPLDGSYAPDRRYKTAEAVESQLKAYAERYPGLVTLRSIGKSGEGRDIWAVKLTSDDFYVDIATKPVVLFNAMHHAREVMSSEVALDTIDYLVTRFDQDPQVKKWLAETEIWVLPMLNVDGNNKVWTADSMWRKNTRGGYGVDINRNYPFQWNKCGGSSGDRGDDAYRGTGPASETETQVMMAFVKDIHPVFDISYHSYGEIVIYPYGCDGQRTPQDDVVEEVGKALAAKIVTDDGRGRYRPGTSWELLYAVDGSDIDWMYHDLHVVPFVIEVNAGFGGGGFQPSYNLRDSTVERLRPAWMHLLDRTQGTGVRGRVSDANGLPLAGAKVVIGGQTYETAADGTYHIVLRPGTYQLSFAAGGRSAEKSVTLGASLKSLSIRL